MRTTSSIIRNQSYPSRSLHPAKAARSSRVIVRAIDLSVVPPLHWWRRLPAETFTSAHLAILRKSIAGIIIMNEPGWPDAVRGDPAAAIGIALRIAKRRSTQKPALDLVMSAVLLAALAGHSAARCALTTMINRYSNNAEKSGLVVSWLGLDRNVGSVDLSANDTGMIQVSRRQKAGA